MTTGRIAAAFTLGLLCCAGNIPSHAADPTPAGVAASDSAAGPGLVVTGAERAMTLTPAVLAAMPTVQVTQPPGPAAPAASEQTPATGGSERTYEGPLLWTVLVHAGVVDPARYKDDVRRTVILTGSDGYTAALALGEISPEFENKRVILALHANGQALASGHLRIVVPGDKRGGRGVHDLLRIAVVPAIPPLR